MAQFDNMAMAMPPPMLPGFSLRVQLFSPNAYASGDKPIRCFRVVTSPEVTIREFCQEASRIHEINYGQPLAIKKCQDDQEFDITQSEILGNLFASTATIRMIQASPHPSIRDSVPPSSALRFDPASIIGQKRDRETSPRTNGAPPSGLYKPNKRQRVSDLDPDQPIPSRESQEEAERQTGSNIIPNSQESIILGASNGRFSTSRQVRPVLPRIPETPSVSPPPSTLKSYNLYEKPTDHHRQKYSDSRSNLQSEVPESSPVKEPPGNAQSHTPSQQRAKSASYHIHRPTERGTSVSTAATSPLSVDQQRPPPNGVTSNKLNASDPLSNLQKSRGNQDRSANEDSIYDNIVSDDEGSAILKAKKAALKIRNSPNSGLKGLEWAKNKFNTPPNGRRRSREQTSPGELPFTPNSREREERKKQKQGADDAREARFAAAEAAEQRKQEADEARQANETHRAEEERAEREEQERIEVEQFKREEAERASRLKREKEKREAEERRLEKERIAKEKVETERLAREKARAEKSKRLQDQEQRNLEKIKVERLKKAKEETKAPVRISSSPPEDIRQDKSSSPVLPRASPFIRTQSTTGFFPNGRKSALKSSQVIRSSSPATSMGDSSYAVGIESQMPLPKSAMRRVSFEGVPDETPPMKPPTKVPPPKTIPPVAKTSTSSTPKPVSKTPILPPPRTVSRILPPQSSVKRPSSERSITPQGQKKIVPLQARKESSPQVAKKVQPPAPFSARRTSAPVAPPAPRKESKSASAEPQTKEPQTVEISSEESESEDAESEDEESVEESSPEKSAPELQNHSLAKMKSEESKGDPNSEDESEDDTPRKIIPAKSALRTQSRSPVIAAEESEEADVETASHHTSTRDSRSPVVYGQHEQAQQTNKAERSTSPESELGSDEDEAESDSTSEDGTAKQDNKEEADSESEDESSEFEGNDGDATIQILKSSSPVLPLNKPARILDTTAAKSNANQSKSKAQSRLGSDPSTQEEIDNQLTSSMIEARTSVPVTSTAAAALSSPSITHKPSIRFGASLKGLNENKQAFSSSAPNSARSGNGRQQLRLQEDEDDDSEEESEEDNDDDESEDDDESTPEPAALVTNVAVPQTRQTPESGSESNSDSESDNSNTSSSGSDNEATKIRNELAAQIQSMHSHSQASIPSPKMYRSTQDTAKTGKEIEKERKVDRYNSGYSFSQPA